MYENHNESVSFKIQHLHFLERSQSWPDEKITHSVAHAVQLGIKNQTLKYLLKADLTPLMSNALIFFGRGSIALSLYSI